jgi:hypothetical protein
MSYSTRRSLYRTLLKLYPPLFRQRFGSEMLHTCDELASESYSQPSLLLDVSRSIVRQWVSQMHSIARTVAEPSLLGACSLLKGNYQPISAGMPPAKYLLQSGFIVVVMTLAVLALERGPRLIAPPMENLTKIDLRVHCPRIPCQESSAAALVQQPTL